MGRISLSRYYYCLGYLPPAACALKDNHMSVPATCSASDGFLYLYDRQHCDRVLRIDAHQDDANAVTFADDSSQVTFWVQQCLECRCV